MAEFLTWFFSTIGPWILVVVHGLVVVGASAHVVLTKRDVNDLLSAITSAYRLTAK